MRKTIFASLAAVLMAAAPAMVQQEEAEIKIRETDAEVQVEEEPRERVQRRQVAPEAEPREAEQRVVAKAMRANNLMDLEIRDLQNEELGDVEDIVLDLETGEIRYVAITVGGVLGVGGDMYAVPWKAFRVQKVEDEWVLTLNANKEKFENAPGFDDDKWPTFADQDWWTANDRYYTEQGVTVDRRERVRVRAE